MEWAWHDRIAYDKLLLTTGGAPRRLPVPGADLTGVTTLRLPSASPNTPRTAPPPPSSSEQRASPSSIRTRRHSPNRWAAPSVILSGAGTRRRALYLSQSTARDGICGRRRAGEWWAPARRPGPHGFGDPTYIPIRTWFESSRYRSEKRGYYSYIHS